MSNRFTPFIIYKPREGEPEGAIEWPTFDITWGPHTGKGAVIVFTTGDKAKEFIKAKGMPADWHAGKMSQPELLRWLRHNLQTGVPAVVVDPTPTEGQSLDILRFLAEFEAE
jgi:hypothetical protein